MEQNKAYKVIFRRLWPTKKNIKIVYCDTQDKLQQAIKNKPNCDTYAIEFITMETYNKHCKEN